MEQIGLKELRQHASAVIRRVEQSGSEIEVTVQGRPAAVITPIQGLGRRARFIRSDILEAALFELRHGDPEWAREVRESRERDSIVDPWLRVGSDTE